MSDSNHKTIESYEEHVQEYIDGTPNEMTDISISAWINESISDLDKDAKILEIGSAFGRDAKYIENQGYRVERTDAVTGFVELLKKQGHDARLLNIVTDDIDGTYDLVFANAVLLHFTDEETKAATAKVYKALKNGGRFSFSLKQGDGEEWSNAKVGAPRFFNYWQPDGIVDILKNTGFEKVKVTGDNLDMNSTKWLRIIAEK